MTAPTLREQIAALEAKLSNPKANVAQVERELDALRARLARRRQLVNFKHEAGPVQLAEMRRLTEIAVERHCQEVLALERRAPAAGGQLDHMLAEARRRLNDQVEILAELDERMVAASPAAA